MKIGKAITIIGAAIILFVMVFPIFGNAAEPFDWQNVLEQYYLEHSTASTAAGRLDALGYIVQVRWDGIWIVEFFWPGGVGTTP